MRWRQGLRIDIESVTTFTANQSSFAKGSDQKLDILGFVPPLTQINHGKGTKKGREKEADVQMFRRQNYIFQENV